ncbi:uncharacterized protein TNCV_4391801 [Trichonephila clavipes]|nr:uncharacterized protein TNCV_4391801 [Trichonephila clavipes]
MAARSLKAMMGTCLSSRLLVIGGRRDLARHLVLSPSTHRFHILLTVIGSRPTRAAMLRYDIPQSRYATIRHLPNPTENSLAVLNHKILEANSQVQNVKLGGHQTCLSINRLWHELCDMLRRLVGTTAPGHHDCSIQE